MTIRHRLILLVLLGLLSLAGVGFVGWQSTELATETMDQVSAVHVPALHQLGQIQEVSADIRAAQYGVLADGQPPTPEWVQQTRAAMSKRWQRLAAEQQAFVALRLSPETTAAWARLAPTLAAWQQTGRQLDSVLAEAEADPRELEQYRALLLEHEAQAQALGQALDRMTHLTLRKVESVQARQSEHIVAIQTAMRVMLVVAVLGFVGVAQWIVRSIVRPLETLRDATETIRRDLDLSRRSPVSGRDEIACTVQAFNGLLDTLHGSLRLIAREGEQVEQVACEVAGAAQQIASATEMESQSAGNMAATVEEMLTGIAQITDNASFALQSSESAQTMASSSDRVITQAAQEINKMVKAIQTSAQDVSALAARTDEISRIVQMIAGVAEQTNLLALNAAIEAARAGESGRGFAVVADEVRLLAEKTRTATGEIGETIQWVQQQTRRAADNLLQGEKLVSFGVTLVGGLVQPLGKLRDGAVASHVELTELSSALKAQSESGRYIGENVEMLASISSQNSAAAVQSATAAQRLHDSARAMQTQLARFVL